MCVHSPHGTVSTHLVTLCHAMHVPAALAPATVTIIAYGGLLSESSSRLTFPDLTNFRLVRVRGMRRLFGMSHLFLTSQGVADPRTTLRIAALTVEPAAGASFVAAAYDVVLDDAQRESFLTREIGYSICAAPFEELDAAADSQGGVGVICAASTDDQLPRELVVPSGLPHVFDWSPSSGLLPADVYLRHCLLAMRKISGEAEESFLHDTFLVDRATTLSRYLEGGVLEQVMAVEPPASMASRFGG
eukprot:1175090-Prymnesium_polylepis.1